MSRLFQFILKWILGESFVFTNLRKGVEFMQMTDEAKEVRREYMRKYMRKWRSKPENQEKEKEYQANYWNRKAKEESSENDED